VTAHHRKRAEDQLRRLLSELLQRRLKDPRLALASVSYVELSTDLRYGTVYLSILGDAEAAREGVLAVRKAASFLRAELARGLRLRHVPELRFELDDRVRAQERIEELLREAGVHTPSPEGPCTETERPSAGKEEERDPRGT
jgi:ribosome-binding factor A